MIHTQLLADSHEYSHLWLLLPTSHVLTCRTSTRCMHVGPTEPHKTNVQKTRHILAASYSKLWSCHLHCHFIKLLLTRPSIIQSNFHLEFSMYTAARTIPWNRVNSINHQFGAKLIKWYHFLFLWETAITNFTILQKLLKVDWPWISAHWEIKWTASVEG
jgi:hypothetical protein